MTANGALDASFGSGGFTALDVERHAASSPVTSPHLTGAKGQISPDANFGEGFGSSKPGWVVRRLTPDGIVDPVFGLVTIPGVADAFTDGSAAVVRPTGQIVVLGVRVDSSGARDRSYGKGGVVDLDGAGASARATSPSPR